MLTPWKKSYDKPIQCIKKQRQYFTSKGLYSQSYGFPMYGCESWTIKKVWVGWEIPVNPWLIHVNVWQKPLQYCKVISLQLIKINENKKQNTKMSEWVPENWCFWTVVSEKILESLLNCKISNQSILEEINPEYSLEGLMLKLQYFGHLIRRAHWLEKTLMLGKTEGRRRGQQRTRWLYGITDSMDTSLSRLSKIVKDKEAWHFAVHGLAKSWRWLSEWTTKSIWNSVNY